MRQISGWTLTVISVMLMNTAANIAWAQGSTMAYGDRKIVIRHMPRLSNPTKFEVTYDTTPEFMDEVVVTYFLLADHSGEGRKKYFFYTAIVRYPDVARGEHRSCVMLQPSAVMHNGGQFIAMAIEFASADNTLLTSGNITSGSGSLLLPSEWWKNPKVIGDKSVVKCDGLVDCSKTPSGMINNDESKVEIIGRTGDIFVLRTVDGGYRCATQTNLGLLPDQISQIPSSSDVETIYRLLQICARLREKPNDTTLLAALGQGAAKISDVSAFCHYVAIYAMGCLCEGDIKRAASAIQTIRSKDPQCPFITQFTRASNTLTMNCTLCAGTGHSGSDLSQVCDACAGKGSVVVKWKANRIFQELLRDGNMRMLDVQAEFGRSEPPQDGDYSTNKRSKWDPESIPAEGDKTPTLIAVSSSQVKNNPQLYGKTALVVGKATTAGRQIDIYWFIILDGILRCRLQQGWSVSTSIQGQQVQVQGTVVPRPDILITGEPHMINCVLVPFVDPAQTYNTGMK